MSAGLKAKTWYAQVSSHDLPGTLQAQADFITKFMPQLFADLDAGRLAGARSVHFHRLGKEVRFRVVASHILPPLVTDIDDRLQAATATGVITNFRSEPHGDWGTPDPAYGTDVQGVATAFTQFLECVSRATVAILDANKDFKVSEHVLWHWLHLVHNPMTGIERHMVEIRPQSEVHRL